VGGYSSERTVVATAAKTAVHITSGFPLSRDDESVGEFLTLLECVAVGAPLPDNAPHCR
jgi:hypothetical protein